MASFLRRPPSSQRLRIVFVKGRGAIRHVHPVPRRANSLAAAGRSKAHPAIEIKRHFCDID
jgi:hypothetical protein